MVTVNSNYCPNYPRGWEGNGPTPEPLQHDENLAAPDRSAPPLVRAPHLNGRSRHSQIREPHGVAQLVGSHLTVTQTVARALREHCHIPFETFFLAAHLGGGKFAYFQGPRSLSEEEIRAVFKRERFLTYSNTTRASRPRGNFSQTHNPAYSLDAGYSARTAQNFEDQWPMGSTRRRRPRRHARRHRDDDVPPIIASSKKAIEIGDSDGVLEFYDRGFKAIQQTACKEVAKAVIKVICPKKQAQYPYRKGAASAPDWWPGPYGPGEKDVTRHVEPDHLWKRERVHVLKHILRLIIEPAARPPSLRRQGHITVAMLETAAMDSLSIFFQDASRPKNARKRPILKEIFKVARMEEKYKRNEIDGTTQVFVQADDMMEYCFDKNEPDEDDPDEDMEEAAEAAIKHDRTNSVTSSQVSPARTTAMPVPPSLSPAASTVHALSAQFQAAEFLHEMPMRANQYGVSTMDLNPDQYAYDGLPSQPSMQAHATASLQLHDMLTANQHHQHQHHDTSRRSSMFTPTTDFAGHSPTAMYHHSPWSQPQSPQSHPTPSTSASSPVTSSPLFAYAPAHHAAAMPTLPLPMPMAQHQHQQQPGNPYAGQYSPHDTLAAAQNHVHHQQQHHQQHQQQQQQQQHVFRAGNIQLSLQHHPGAAVAGGYGQGQG